MSNINVNTNIVNNIINIIISDCNIQSIIFSNKNKTTLNQLLSCLKIDKYYKCGDKNVYCTICCETVKQKEYIRELPCKHMYHKRCIDRWLYVSINENEDITCPLCRKRIEWY